MFVAGFQHKVGFQFSTVIPDMDFETYSGAGYHKVAGKWKTTRTTARSGLDAVGAAVYAEHPTTEVLCLSYDLKDGKGERLWVPGMPPPQELFDYLSTGGPMEAFNSMFEALIWDRVCHKRMGWPKLQLRQLRDAAAKSRGFSAPGGLKDAAKALEVEQQKDTDGQRLLKKFSQPQNPTKNQPFERLHPATDHEDGAKLYEYCVQDIRTEAAVSAKLPDLNPLELETFLVDQEINFRGVYVDRAGVEVCIKLLNEVTHYYTSELIEITGGAVGSVGENKKILDFLNGLGVSMPNMQQATVEEMLSSHAEAPHMPPLAARVLEIREAIGGAAVKKLFALDRTICSDNRVRGLFAFCGGDRTGRWAGRGAQPQNFPNSGPDVVGCTRCKVLRERSVTVCPTCKSTEAERAEWDVAAVEGALRLFECGFETVRQYFPKPLDAVSGCLRGLFTSAPGHDLICSDYSAIEAVVLACLSGEQWRIDVFNGHGKIYEMSAAKITGIPFEDMMEHKRTTGEHHPMRKKIGKVAELASGFGGWINAWKAFGAGAFMSDEEMKRNILAWRAASPAIVAFWRQVENCFKQAIQFPGKQFDYRGLAFAVVDDILYIRLLSGRFMAYHSPRATPHTDRYGRKGTKLTYMGRDSKTKKWVRLDTYGGKITENLCQATARDIFAFNLVNLEHAGYPVVLHTHDEMTAEVPEGRGSVEDFERIMATRPDWCKDWPIKAAGGWREKRYGKD